MAKRVSQPAAKAVPRKDVVMEAMQDMDAGLMRAFMSSEVLANPMFGFRFGVTYLVGRAEPDYRAYQDLIGSTFKRLETEDPTFARMMAQPDPFGFPAGMLNNLPPEFQAMGLNHFGPSSLTMREETMAEMGDVLARLAEQLLQRGQGQPAAALALGGLVADYALVGTRFGLLAPDQRLPVQDLAGVMNGLAPQVPAELAAEWLALVLDLLGKGAAQPHLPTILLLQLAGFLVRTPAQHEQLMALYAELTQRLTAAPAGKRGPVRAPQLVTRDRLTLLFLQAKYLAEPAARPLEARKLLEANLELGNEVRQHYLTYFEPAEVLDVLLAWTAPSAPSWAQVERLTWLHELANRAEAQGRPDVVREAARRQLREILLSPYGQFWDAQTAWNRLRGTYPAAEWPAARPQEVSQLEKVPVKQRLVSNDFRHNLGAALDKFDTALDATLRELRKRPRFEVLRTHAAFWLPERAAELAELYAKALPDHLDDSNNKNGVAYQLVANTLWRLVQEVEAEAPVVALVEELAVTYSRRRLLIEALRTVGFSVGKGAKPTARVLGSSGNGDEDDEPSTSRRPTPLMTPGDLPPRRGGKGKGRL